MRNQLRHLANIRLAARFADMLDDWPGLRGSLLDLVSAGLALCGAVAFGLGLVQGPAAAPVLLVAGAFWLAAGALAILFNRAGNAFRAVLVQAVVLGVTGVTVGWGAGLWLPASMFFIAGAAHFAVSSRGRVGGQEEEHALAQLIESVSDGLVKLTAEGHVLYASPRTELMFGCKAFSLAEAGLLQRVHVLDRPVFLKAASDTIHTGSTPRIELRMRRDPAPDERAETRFVWTEISFATGPEGTVLGLIRDISTRKEQEQQLESALQEAEEASSSKSLFLATMGHELRTPLNAIVGFSEMMTSGIGGTLEGSHAEYASLIGQSGRHLLDVVNMLLDMSKINAGKFELHLEEFEPDRLVEPSLHMVNAMARANRVHLRTDVSAALPILKGDERACRQIIINLMSNAIKFSPVDGVVSLSIKRQGAKLNITVSDKGIGMTKEQVARIGEPFFQAHAGLARQYEGTGLGLSIVKGLVELHDGVLRANSTPGEGTTITVLLPLLGPEIAQESASVTPLHPAADNVADINDEPTSKRSIAS